MMRTYRNLPAIPSGYPLDDVWSVLVPIARTNLVTNPSFETNTTSWTAIGGSIARVTTQQYHGAYSLAITPTATTTDGARYDTVSLTSGTTYAYHTKLRGVAGLKYKLAIETTGGVELAAVTFTATGRWQWIVGYYTETSTTTRRVTARKAGHANIALFYLDGVNCEAIVAGELASTHIDGDQIGLVPNQLPQAYWWNGTPHASSSTRSAQTRAGGMVIPFKKYGFLLTAIIGLGLAGVQNISTDYARIDGSYDDYTRKPSRQFTLTGRFQGRTYAELRRNRSGLAQLIDRDLTGQDQRLVLLRHVEDASGRIVSSTVRSLVKYESGFGGNTDNMHAETVPITFTQYLPGVLSDGESGGALDVQDSVANADYFIKRSPAGVWSVPGGGTGAVFAIARGLDGQVYLAGNFANWGGNASADNIVKYDPVLGTYSALSTGTNGAVFAMAVLPDGRIVLGGAFTLAGGVANTVRIAVYNPTTNLFTALGTGASTNNVLALAVDAIGGIYAGGDFALMGGVANTLRLAYWNGSAWTALSTGADNTVNALVMGLDERLYITGQFSNLGAVAALQIGNWDGSVFRAMGTGLNSTGGRALARGPNGLIYVGGIFTLAGGISGTSHIAQWNGVTFQGMGNGLGSDVLALSVDPQGIVYATGSFAGVSGGVAFPDGVARFNGAAWTTIGIDTPAISGTINASLAAPDGTLYLVYSGTGTATAEGVATISNPGTARSYPTVTIGGPSSGTARIYSLINYTTNRAIYLNLTINAGETCKLVFTPDNLSFTSDFQGNIASTILGGSNEADFFLQPGANSIAFLSASGAVTAVMHFRPTYASIDDVP